MGTFGKFAELPARPKPGDPPERASRFMQLSHAALPAMVERGRGRDHQRVVAPATSPTPSRLNGDPTPRRKRSSRASAKHPTRRLRGTGVTSWSCCPGFHAHRVSRTGRFRFRLGAELLWQATGAGPEAAFARGTTAAPAVCIPRRAQSGRRRLLERHARWDHAPNRRARSCHTWSEE